VLMVCDFEVDLSRIMALMATRSLLATAMRASFLAFPAAMRGYIVDGF